MKRVLIGTAIVLLLVGGAVVLYLQVVRDDPDPRLGFTDSADAAAPGDAGSDTSGTSGVPPRPADIEGTWVPVEGSQVGYRVMEDYLDGLGESEATGRTSAVTGSLAIDGTTVTEATFTADLTSLESNDPARDSQVQGRILNTDEFPDATFVLSEPIELAAAPAEGETVRADATGTLTLHGVTREVSFEAEGKALPDHLEVLATIPITFADFDIPNPSNAVVRTRDNGELEVLLVLERDA